MEARIPCSKYAHFQPFRHAMIPANAAASINAICGSPPASLTMDQTSRPIMTSMTKTVCHIGIFLPIIKSSYTYKI